MPDAFAHVAVRPPRSGGGTALAAALLAQSETGLLALDAGLLLVTANDAAKRLLGLPDAFEAALGSTLADAMERAALLGPDARRALLEAVQPGGAPQTRIPLTDGRTIAVECVSGPDRHVLLVLKPQDALPRPANRTDPLTGLADRARFKDRLAALAAAPDADIAVLMIDLDRFKTVNDSLGHSVGDALLELVAKRLTAALRDADVISRFGGDEFAVAMPAPADPQSVGRRLIKVLSRPYLVERATATIGASVGVALSSQHGSDPAGLIRAADVALYAAKESGRGAVRVFDPELDRVTRRRHALADDLRKAIPLRQFELHYQPQMNLATRALTGFEALVRWRHPALGMVAPDAFIALAEETGFICSLGEWVLHAACREATTWPGNLTVAVNVSPKQLLDRTRLPRTVQAVLAKTGLHPERLELEITESALVSEADAFAVLREVQALGVRVSMDDFGTGYSSLSQLRRFPFNKLKIDRSFVRDLGCNEEAAAVVRAIAALGNSLGMTTIAEGVETVEQEQQVKLDGCTAVQGYLLSKPVPAAEIGRLIDHLTRTHPHRGDIA